MPETINSSEFQAARRGRPPVYDWDALLQDGYFRFVRGVDFNCQPVSFRQLLQMRARQRGISCVTAQKDGDVYAHITTNERITNEQ